jgi:hypothetical protein
LYTCALCGHVQVVVTDGKGSSETPALSIQDRRKQILRQVTSKKKAISSGLSTAAVDGVVPQKSQSLKRSLSPSPVSNRRAHSKSPKRPRSTSPIENSPVKNRKRPVQKLVSVSVKAQEVSGG